MCIRDSIKPVVIRQDRFKSYIEFLNPKFCEIAQPSIINTKNRNFMIAYQPCSRNHRPVASKDKEKVDCGGKLIGIELFDGTAGLVLNALSIDFWSTNQADTPFCQPLREFTNCLLYTSPSP